MTGPSPRVVIDNRRRRVRELKLLKMRNHEIVDALRIENIPTSQRTLSSDLRAMKKDDKRWLDRIAKDEFVTYYRNAIENIQLRQRRLEVISEQATTDYAKVQAQVAIADLELTILKILEEGPTVREFVGRAERVVIGASQS